MDPSLPSTKIRVISGLSSPPKDGLCIFVPPSLPTSVYFPLEIVAFSYNLSLFPPLPSLFQCLIFTNTYLFVICSPPAGSLSLICFSLILKLLASPDCDHSPLLLIRDLSEILYHLSLQAKRSLKCYQEPADALASGPGVPSPHEECSCVPRHLHPLVLLWSLGSTLISLLFPVAFAPLVFPSNSLSDSKHCSLILGSLLS